MPMIDFQVERKRGEIFGRIVEVNSQLNDYLQLATVLDIHLSLHGQTRKQR